MLTLKFSRKTLGIPYAAFLTLFVAAPLLVLIYYAFTNGQGQFTLKNLTGFFTDPNTLGTLCYSFAIALTTTCVALLIAYPTAYFLAKSHLKRKAVLVMLFVMPMWINFSLRITALKEILTVIEGNLAYYPFLNAVVGMTYDFLPFMILPIYNALMKLDDSIIEAAYDLGAEKPVVLGRIVLPLIVPGIASGVTMVFVPSLTTFVISNILGGGKIYLIGNIIEQEFTTSANWNLGSGLSLVMMVFVLGSMAILSALDKSGEGVSL